MDRVYESKHDHNGALIRLYRATIRSLLAPPLSPPSCFLIATNLCEIVNVALILRFVILISNIFYANLYLFHRSKEN